MVDRGGPSGGGSSGGGSAVPIVPVILTASRRRLVAIATVAFLLPVALYLAMVPIPAFDRSLGPALISGVILGAILATVVYFGSINDRIELTPGGLGSSVLWRSSAVPWDEITAVEERRRWGSRVVRVTARGRTFRLITPSSGKGPLADPDFDTQYATIRTWWQAYGSDVAG